MRLRRAGHDGDDLRDNCSNCGVTHPIEGSFFSITDLQRTLSVLSVLNVSQMNAANLPAGVSIDYTVAIDLPNGLTEPPVVVCPSAKLVRSAKLTFNVRC